MGFRRLQELRRSVDHGVESLSGSRDFTIGTEYKKLSPTPAYFPKFVQRLVATFSKGYDFGADKLRATPAPMFFIHGDMGPRTASRLAILPDTTHVPLMQRVAVIVPMVNDFLDAEP